LRNAVKRAGWLPSVARAPLIRTYRVLGAGLANSSRLAARARSAVAEREQAFDCVIGVDPDGLVLANTLARGAPLAYFSLELLLSYELTTPVDRQLKLQERELSKQAEFLIVQDAARGKLIAEDNNLPMDRLVLVPNAPPGPARRRPSRYWHERFNLPANARVVLHAGSLGDWTGVEDLVGATATWPEPWVFVVHTRYDAESTAYVERLKAKAAMAPGRVFLSLRPVPRQDYDALIDGADVGLAFYIPDPSSAFTQRNLLTLGLSSGKLAYYLRAGLPVVVNCDASIAEEVEAHRMGVVVREASQVAGALARISQQYEWFSANATRFFEEKLDFRRAFSEVVRRLEALQ